MKEERERMEMEEKKIKLRNKMFFYFEQKTAYEIKECDWSSDVCSSDLRLCAQSPHTGIAANDSHHNQGLRATCLENGRVQLSDGLGEPMTVLDAAKTRLLAPLLRGKQPGDVVFEMEIGRAPGRERG